MVTEELATRTNRKIGIDVPVGSRSRSVKDLPATIRSALRRVVHEYVTGWGIVLTQTPRERRRKKRLWDCRTSQRYAFRRPVWVHKARWGESSSDSDRTIVVECGEVMYLVHDLSETGIGLTSDTPPKSRLVVLKFDAWQGQPVELLVQLRWRKRIGEQDYRCGGSILGVLAPA
jgi:hypothetical protein